MRQPRNEGGGGPMSVRHRGDAPFITRRLTVAPRPIRCRPGFIQKNQLCDIQSWLGRLPLTPCGLHVGACVLAGVQGFF
jgi:hypothetical protein